MVDLDHFKKINDCYGHNIGDRALVHATDILRNTTRDTDLVARWGGEEFAILIAADEQCELLAAAENMRLKLATTRLEFSVDEHTKHPIQVFASIGVSEIFTGEEDAEGLIQDSDMALYAAKGKGDINTDLYAPPPEVGDPRNRVCFVKSNESREKELHVHNPHSKKST